MRAEYKSEVVIALVSLFDRIGTLFELNLSYPEVRISSCGVTGTLGGS
jgi:hypothetical protein